MAISPYRTELFGPIKQPRVLLPGRSEINVKMSTLAGHRFARLELLPALGMAAGLAASEVASGFPAPWRWAVVGALLLLVAAGWRLHPALPAIRGAALVAGAWASVAGGGGLSPVVLVALAAAALAYPVLLAGRLGAAYPAAATASYLGVVIVGGASPSAHAPALVLMMIGGYLAWLLGAASARLEFEREEAETEARRAQGRFRVAFANASSGMAMMGLDGRIHRANQALSDYLEIPVADLEGRDWWDFLHEDDRNVVRSKVDQLMATEIWSFQQQVRCVPPGRRLAYALLGMSLVTDDEGAPLYLFAHVQDVTERTRTERRLRLSEEHYRNLFGRSPVAIWEADFTAVGEWLADLRHQGVTDLRSHLATRPDLVRDGIDLIRIVDVNDAAGRLVEAAEREELLRGVPQQMLTDETLEGFVDQFVAVWNGRDRTESNITSRTLQGRPIDLIMHWVVPNVSGDLDLTKVVVAFPDITEYRRTQEALRRIEERLRTVVGAAPIVLFALDRHGVLTLTEGEGLSVLGLGAGEAVGRSIFELFRDSPQLVAAVRRALAGEAFTTSVELRNLDFDIRFTPIWEEGRVDGVVGVANDVTERKRASQRLEQLVRTKDEFVAAVSHELRTPLTAVVGFAQELRENLEMADRLEIETFVDLIAEQSMEVADLVEDLLVAARVDIDKVAVAPEPVVVKEQIEAVLSAWQAEQAARVEVAGGNEKAFADPVRLRQILRNLLSNAQRYGGDHIDVQVGGDVESITVLVRDNGPGIPERDREKIFEPYHRAHRFEGQPASVGLGLTVSRQLARLMGGDLSYRYEGGLSVFELTLPSLG